ncbi:DUF6083 domain-containing protein [Streptomyces sp. NPDC059970]|uniref:DUF6083 domain-containing protein n=1 Tax=Streptomyces sp. NPDC059970 TaxID=3347019 RepID=UPI00368BB364
MWDAEPLPGAQCRIAHRMVCPCLPREDPPLWATALRQENERRAQRLFNLPDDWDLPDTGRPRPDRPGTVSTGGVRFTTR